MFLMSLSRAVRVVAACSIAVAALTLQAPAQPTTDAAVKAIDGDCNAIDMAIMALKPVHVMLQASTWKVVADADWVAAQQTHASVTFVDAWKQGSNYAWVHSHTFDASGNQRATQLCFRQADGSLQRARQAGTVPALDAAGAQEAYFAPDGSLIVKVGAFEVNDPAVAKSVKALPFYANLP